MKGTNRRRGFTLIELLIVISIIGILATLGITTFPIIKKEVNKMKSKSNLSEMYKLLMIYNMTYHTYPSMQPKNTMYTRGGGVRDLYPLYQTSIMNKDALQLLRPPGCALIPFSNNPTPDEFNKEHIGYSYNSTVVPDDSQNPPLMAERGAADGLLKREEKPVFEDGIHVLMCDGQVKWIPAINGKLQPGDITTPDQLAKLLE